MKPRLIAPLKMAFVTNCSLGLQRAAGFKTFVIGVGSEDEEIETLNKVADAGGKRRAGMTRFYPANNRAELDAALAAITFSLTTWVFPVATRPMDPDYVSVTVGTTLVPRDLTHVAGWDYVVNGAAIEIYGSVCEDLENGTALNVGIHFGCAN